MNEGAEHLGESISRSTGAVEKNDSPMDFTAYLHKPREGTPHRGWYKPGHLPHFDAAKVYQLITYHLADSLPKAKLDQFKSELKNADTKRMDAERRQMIEQWLDAGHGSCVLKNPACAQQVIDAWKHFDGTRYRLMAWTVMPNHVHVLIQQLDTYRLADIVAAWKKFTARRINALCAAGSIHLQIDQRRSGAQHSRKHLWQRGYWDRFIRNEQHFHAAIDYVLKNAKKAKLVDSAKDWPWSGVATSIAGNGLSSK